MIKWVWKRKRAAERQQRLIVKMNAFSRDGAVYSGGRNNKTSLGVVSHQMLWLIKSELLSLLRLIIYCQQLGFPTWLLRMKRKSVPQFQLKFISVCQDRFIHDIALVPWYVYQSVLVKRNGWLFKPPPSNNIQRRHVDLWATLFHTPVNFDRSSTNSVWDTKKSRKFISTVDIKLNK